MYVDFFFFFCEQSTIILYPVFIETFHLTYKLDNVRPPLKKKMKEMSEPLLVRKPIQSASV